MDQKRSAFMFKQDREVLKRWVKVSRRWNRKSKIWKWVYNHAPSEKLKEVAFACYRRCCEEAAAFVIGTFTVCSDILDKLDRTDIISNEEES